MIGFTLTSRLRIGLVAAAAAVAVSALGAGTASANVPCGGASIQGKGSPLQNDAHQNAWQAGFNASVCTGVGAPTATYGRTDFPLPLWGANGTATPVAATYGFLGTDDAPNPTQKSNMERSIASGGTGSGVINVPVTQTALAIVVNLPANCALSGITAANLETAFRGTASPTWTMLGAIGAGCGVAPKRVVRADAANATWVLKGYLNRANSSLFCTGSGPWTWATLQAPTNNITWCNDSNAVQYSGLNGTGTPGTGLGGGDEVKSVSNTDNSIGYAALPDAKNSANDPSGTTSILTVRGLGALTTQQSPANGTNANCSTASGAYTNAGGALPNPDADWSAVSFSAPGTTYAICALTYDLALKDDQPLFGSGTPGKSVGQTVFDYLSYAISTAGATAVSGRYYASLPTDVRTKSTAGLALISSLLP